ncbi:MULTISPECIES: hypothetical protein [unclassified Paenibacillus]|uniref:BC1872 family protein n=1 Tax=unclassified Paenibacillus TaxID=185978 RepID=UPI0024054580|nr:MULTISPECIES: hypothetical protein [unclassified Paenibacillus]MDF9841764.1 hypothetical protein [Paenibacillus sp. PastF-2]MDF9848555.1 hypothetical protein [Paenibacillus sp. PastM-2]MDF9854923.1 hypothetical protein [Paenibacillus sp. PastF-1]MDH6480193.1 hypothetical protein [Paenibacillus sp. PastH-2]MDH6507823.1 hypothetical protein [Paenibacillus sp. PastM-3]
MNNTWSNLTSFERNLLVGIKVMDFPNNKNFSDDWKNSFTYHHDLGMWNYSTNPRQAYDVIEKLIDEGHVVEIKIHNLKQFFCRIALSTEILSGTSFSEAESFQESICLAALRAKGYVIT